MTLHNNDKDNDDDKTFCHKENAEFFRKFVLGYSSDSSSSIDDDDEPLSKRMCFLDSTHDDIQENMGGDNMGGNSGNNVYANHYLLPPGQVDVVKNQWFASILFPESSDDDDREKMNLPVNDNFDELTNFLEEDYDDNGNNDNSGSETGEEESLLSTTDTSSEILFDNSSPSKSKTHIDIEKSQQKNLFLLLPKLHREWTRVEARQIVSQDQHCDRCHCINLKAYGDVMNALCSSTHQTDSVKNVPYKLT